MSSLNDETTQSLLNLWFPGFGLNSSTYPENPQSIFQMWFRQNDEFDGKCRKFKPLLSELAASYDKTNIATLASTPQQALALVLLLDQLSRNCFRGTGFRDINEIFDPMAQAVAEYSTAAERRFDLGENGVWRGFPPARMWFLMPYMHAESEELQNRGTEKAAEVVADAGENGAGKLMAGSLVQHMAEHGDVVRQFGRFPNRNKNVGRESTEAEKKWLEETEHGWAR